MSNGNGIKGVGGFGTYTLINSALQFLTGFYRRSDNEKQQKLKDDFERELVELKETFEAEKAAREFDINRAKLELARKYKAIENQDKQRMKDKLPELTKFIKEDCPIAPGMLNTLLTMADASLAGEAEGKMAPLNVLLLIPHKNIDRDQIALHLQDVVPQLGSARFLDYTYKPACGNSALLNLNVVMRDMPTLVVSPRYVKDEKKTYYSAALWDSNSTKHPYIKPLFATDFDHEQLRTSEQQKKMCEQVVFATTMIVGCARDSYMLMANGLPPTLPALLKSNEWEEMQQRLLAPGNEAIARFVSDEYKCNVSSLLSQGCVEDEGRDYINQLTGEAKKAAATLSSIIGPIKS